MNIIRNKMVRKNTLLLSLILLGTIMFSGCKNNSENKTSIILEKALSAVGGRDALLSLNRFQISTIGSSYASFMGLAPDHVKETSTYSKKYTVQIDNGAIRTDAIRKFTYVPEHGFPEQRYRVVTKKGTGQLLMEPTHLDYLVELCLLKP
ncbi:hypothetical protein [Flagellimonas sp. CMM7]|uniref:hypothetical protein n=1 Tax=Flagellimonas sp. CMM7 TaxID=2654676 RepID=UPI0013D5D1E4|nr:hypothetical protein [Flagellimonas sp. CMM7]UII78782.1 hypothetical protein LV704_14060 [Flagellimonas sp. CMM7]